MGKSFCPRKVAARFKYFSLKPRGSVWGFEIVGVEMSVLSVSDYLATLTVERRVWLNGCNKSSMPGAGGGGTSRGCSAQILVDLFQSRNAILSQSFEENQFCFYKVVCAVLFLPTSFPLAAAFKKNMIVHASLLNGPAPEMRPFVLLDRLGHNSCNLGVCEIYLITF